VHFFFPYFFFFNFFLAGIGAATWPAREDLGKTPRHARLLVALAALGLSAAVAPPPAMPALRVVTVPVLSDNYAYLVVDEESRTVGDA